ncbi:uncharacterized protein LOC132612823 [Lycium barbarum]|uniref:uncharacterized protein LOC132612823 n=1 Tax=Lycium barbarum TaxID=112863 RepID=UPI00293EE9B4|nr:uncharacterized protein LOC132612823 [Lycium barbarum]
MGNSGGLVVVWKDDALKVDDIFVTTQGINSIIKVNNSNVQWFFSTIYASNNLADRKTLWDQLCTMSDNIRDTDKSLVGGDFNEILKASDKFGGNNINFNRDSKVADSPGPKKDIGIGKISFLKDLIDVLQIMPGSISTQMHILETMWCSHPNFNNMVGEHFEFSQDLTHYTDSFGMNLIQWNKEVFGSIFFKKKRLFARLEGIQKSQSYPYSTFLQNLEANLQDDYDDILRQKSEFWRLKSRISWLNEGDSNTKFFYISTLNRRRRNRILSLKDAVGNWIQDTKGIKENITNYYQNLFSTDPTTSPLLCATNPSIRGALTHEEKEILRTPLTIKEIKQAVFSFKSYKAPGPEGMHPFLYQKFWSTISNPLIDFCKKTFTTLNMDKQINHTYIFLIPKRDNTTMLKNF